MFGEMSNCKKTQKVTHCTHNNSLLEKSPNILIICSRNMTCICVANRFVNLGFDHYHTESCEKELVRMEVFTNRIGNYFAYFLTQNQY